MSAEHNVKKVLVVDDDSVFHFLMKRMLLTIGIAGDSIQTASSGKEALDLVVTCQLSGIPFPDIILLDLNMPIMGGFEFLEAYRKLPLIDQRTTRIIIISSSLNDRDINRSLQLGASRYLTKPVTETELQQILK